MDRESSKFPRVPYDPIKRYVDRMHVATMDEKIAADIRERATKSTETYAGAPAACTPEETEECVRWALEVHQYNRAVYTAVMSGRIYEMPDAPKVPE